MWRSCSSTRRHRQTANWQTATGTEKRERFFQGRQMYKTIEDTVGNTPLVRLKRLPGNTSNVVLAKLEGNNPAGSVKDRPALSMVVEAEARGEIKRGDTLIE